MANTLRVLATHAYPGYQFIARFEHRQYKPEQCFRFLILTVLDWISSRLGDDALDQELGARFPMENAAETCFRSLSREDPCKLDIVSMIDDGIWAASIAEPDMDRTEHKAVVGRSFTTNIGIALAEDERKEKIVTLGVRIDVRDPENAPAEVPYAYRPAFIKKLFENPDVVATQAGYPVKRGCFLLGQDANLTKLSTTLSDRNCFLPALIFTSAFNFSSMEQVLTDVDRMLGLTDTEGSILKQARMIDETPERIGRTLLGYCRVFLVPGAVFEQFKRTYHLSDDFSPGDMLFIEPAVFGHGSMTIKYKDEQSRILQSDYFEGLKERLMAYSKRKAYSFEPVVFVPEALSIQRQKRVETIRRETESLTFDQLSDVVAENEAEINRLENRLAELERENEILKSKIHQNGGMSSIPIRVPEIDEYFPGELRDLILTVLRNRDSMSGSTPDTRATELLRAIVQLNEPGNNGAALFDRIKRIFNGHKNLSEGDFSELRALGFVIEEVKQGDGHIRMRFMTSPRFHSIASTGSDVRGMKNSFSTIEKTESVYKV